MQLFYQATLQLFHPFMGTLSFVNCHHSKSLWICRFYLNFVKSLLNVRSESLLFPATSVNHGDWITLKIAFFFLLYS